MEDPRHSTPAGGPNNESHQIYVRGHRRQARALEYNVVRWGRTELPPTAGVAIYARGQSGKPAAARIYDDVSPPLERFM